MTSSLKITVFFILAVTISCYGQATSSNNTITVESDCRSATTCNECLNVTNCTFTAKLNCSQNPPIQSEYSCNLITVSNTTVNPTDANNCSLKELEQCKVFAGDNATAGETTVATTTEDGLPMMPTQEESFTTEPSAPSSEVTSAATPTAAGDSLTTETTKSGATTAATSIVTGPAEVTNSTEVTTGAGTTEEPTTPVVSTTSKDNSSTTPEHHSSTDGHPSTSDHTEPAKQPSRHFDAPSFIGGIILSIGLLAIAFVGYKFYRARTEHNYHTL